MKKVFSLLVILFSFLFAHAQKTIVLYKKTIVINFSKNISYKELVSFAAKNQYGLGEKDDLIKLSQNKNLVKKLNKCKIYSWKNKELFLVEFIAPDLIEIYLTPLDNPLFIKTKEEFNGDSRLYPFYAKCYILFKRK